jgi:hypothetical protein
MDKRSQVVMASILFSFMALLTLVQWVAGPSLGGTVFMTLGLIFLGISLVSTVTGWGSRVSQPALGLIAILVALVLIAIFWAVP